MAARALAGGGAAGAAGVVPLDRVRRAVDCGRRAGGRRDDPPRHLRAIRGEAARGGAGRARRFPVAAVGGRGSHARRGAARQRARAGAEARHADAPDGRVARRRRTRRRRDDRPAGWRRRLRRSFVGSPDDRGRASGAVGGRRVG